MKKHIIQIFSLLLSAIFLLSGATLVFADIFETKPEAVPAALTALHSSSVSSNGSSMQSSSSKPVSSKTSAPSKPSVSSQPTVKRKKPATKNNDYIEEIADKMQDIPESLKNKKNTVSSKDTSTRESSSKRSPSKKNSSKNTSSKKTSSKKASSENTSSKQTSSAPHEPQETVFLSVRGKVTELDAYDAVCQNVMAEMGSSFFSEEAVKAQAVAAHTYMRYYNDELGKAPSLPLKAPSDKVKKCVDQVFDKLIYYNGTVINAVYTAFCNGQTAEAADVWGVKIPYLVSVESKYDHLASGFESVKSYTESEFKKIISEKTGITLSGNAADWLKVLSQTKGGYAGSISIGGKTQAKINKKNKLLTGILFRDEIMSYSIKSHSFTYSAANGYVSLTTKGYGHCVGLSQYGAHYYAEKDGWNYKKILRHYYTGVTIK